MVCIRQPETETQGRERLSKLDDRVEGNQVLNKLSPPYLCNTFELSIHKTGRSLRNDHRIFIPFVRTNIAKSSFYYQGAVIWIPYTSPCTHYLLCQPLKPYIKVTTYDHTCFILSLFSFVLCTNNCSLLCLPCVFSVM